MVAAVGRKSDSCGPGNDPDPESRRSSVAINNQNPLPLDFWASIHALAAERAGRIKQVAYQGVSKFRQRLLCRFYATDGATFTL